jgi:hypothetical protein
MTGLVTNILHNLIEFAILTVLGELKSHEVSCCLAS